MPIFHTVFAHVYHYAISELTSAKACTITMGSDTSPHVLRFTGFRPQARAPPLGVCLPHQPNAAATVRSVLSGSGVSEGVSEAPTFMEWGTMVVLAPPARRPRAAGAPWERRVRVPRAFKRPANTFGGGGGGGGAHTNSELPQAGFPLIGGAEKRTREVYVCVRL